MMSVHPQGKKIIHPVGKYINIYLVILFFLSLMEVMKDYENNNLEIIIELDKQISGRRYFSTYGND